MLTRLITWIACTNTPRGGRHRVAQAQRQYQMWLEKNPPRDATDVFAFIRDHAPQDNHLRVPEYIHKGQR